MKTKILSLVISLNFVFFYTNPLQSCTTFCIHTDEELVFGKNYDWMISDGIVFVNKKDIVKTAFTKKNSPATWVSKYGSVTFNQFGREFPMGGMNEAGLVVELMWLDDTKYPDADERPATGGVLQWIQYQLDNSETIQEVIDTDKLIRIPTAATPIHFLITDKYGSTASIEFLDGKLVAHKGETMKFRSLTNDTYEKSIEYLKNFKEFGGEKDLPNESGSLERFAKSCSMLKNYTKKENRTAVDYGFEILKDVIQGDATKWSIVYDIKNMQVYFNTYDNKKIKSIDFAALDFNCTSPVIMIDINSNLEGNINNSLTEYNIDANRKLIEDSYNGVDFLKGVSKEDRDLTSTYPEKLNCKSKSGIEMNYDNNDNNDKNYNNENNSIATSFIILFGVFLCSVALIAGYKGKNKNKKS
ncbi:MAG: linear amide C-N hydrolase [Bacteroidota bacterium]|nr:linear amide C-N hydrolase [Bacteroidota bacterium]